MSQRVIQRHVWGIQGALHIAEDEVAKIVSPTVQEAAKRALDKVHKAADEAWKTFREEVAAEGGADGVTLLSGGTGKD